MRKHEILNRMLLYKALAIVRTDDVEEAYNIANILIENEIPVMEISYTNLQAGRIIRALKDKFKQELICGAGTVLDEQCAFDAIKQGADFIIAPNFQKNVALMCNRYQIPYGPGCSTLTEVVEALSFGASFIKAFPISNFYGPKLISVIKTPLPNILMMASGGLNCNNLPEWIDSGTDLFAFGGLLTKGTSKEISHNAALIKTIIQEKERRS